MMKRKKHTLWLELGGAVLWCLVTLFTDKLFFWYDWHSWRFFAYKALFILAAFGVIHGVVTLVQKVREKDSFTLRWLRWTLPYLAVTLLLLLVLWPGIWGNDDKTILDYARTLEPFAWHHFLTSVWFIISLMFLPMVGGIVLIQTILIAGIVGLFIAEAQTLAEQRLQKPLKSGWFVLLYLPFLLPPVVMHDMQLFRMVYSNWVELLVLFLLVRWYLRNTAIKRWELVLFAVLGAVAAAWRSEAIYYAAALPILLLILMRKGLLKPIAAGAASAVIVVGALACSRYNASLMGNDLQYQTLALCSQAAALVQDADPVSDVEEFAMIDNVYSVQKCRENSNLHKSDLFGAVVQSNLTEEGWSACKKGIVKLALKYPKSLLRERLGMFRATMQADYGGSRQKDFFGFAYVCYDLDGYYLTSIERAGKIAYQSPLAFPINQDLRKAVIGTMVYDTETPLGKLISTTWFMLPPLLLLFVEALVLAVRKKWFLFLVTGTLCLRVVLVFLTAPDSFFMYYLTPYIAGYAIAAAGVVYEVMRRKLKVERNPG